MSSLTQKHFEHETIKEFSDGERIFEEGDLGRDLYIIQKGSVEIRKMTALGEVPLAHFNRGEFFGELALVHSIPRTAAAVSVGASTLIILQPGGFLLKIRRDPTFAFEMIQQLSHRVKVSNDRIVALVERTPVTPGELETILRESEERAR